MLLKPTYIYDILSLYTNNCNIDIKSNIKEMTSYVFRLLNLFSYVHDLSIEKVYFTFNIFNYFCFGYYDKVIFNDNNYERFFDLISDFYEIAYYENYIDVYEKPYFTTLNLVNLIFPEILENNIDIKKFQKLSSNSLIKFLNKPPKKKVKNLTIEDENIKERIKEILKREEDLILTVNNSEFYGVNDYFSNVKMQKITFEKKDEPIYSYDLSELFHSSSKYLNQNVNGIRRIRNTNDLVKLLPSNILYFLDDDIFAYLFSENALYTYEHMNQVEISDIKIFFDISEVFLDNSLLKKQKIFISSYLKTIFLNYLYFLINFIENNEFLKSNSYKFYFVNNVDVYEINPDLYDYNFHGLVQKIYNFNPEIFSNDFLELNINNKAKLHLEEKNDSIIINIVFKRNNSKIFLNKNKFNRNFERYIEWGIKKVGNDKLIFNIFSPKAKDSLSPNSFLKHLIKLTIQNIYLEGEI